MSGAAVFIRTAALFLKRAHSYRFAPSTPNRHNARNATLHPAGLPAPDQSRDCPADGTVKTARRRASRRARRHDAQSPPPHTTNSQAHGGSARRENKKAATWCACKARSPQERPSRRGLSMNGRWRVPLRWGAPSLGSSAPDENKRGRHG